jgi:hypothetical protein
VLETFSNSSALFRKTSCAVSYAHGLPDYNGHYGIRELCDICPLSQLELCAGAHRVPTAFAASFNRTALLTTQW